jgi:hypothetical protein
LPIKKATSAGSPACGECVWGRFSEGAWRNSSQRRGCVSGKTGQSRQGGRPPVAASAGLE